MMTHRDTARLTPLIPLAGLLAGQGLLIAWLASAGRLGATRASVAVALLVLATGLAPALIRPRRDTALAAAVAALLAGVLLAPLGLEVPPPLASEPALLALSGGAVLRIAHLALLGPALLWFAAAFPAPTPAGPAPLRAAALVAGPCLAALTLALPARQAIAPLVLLVGWFAALAGAAAGSLARAARDPAPARAAQARQARVVLATVLLAELPLLLRPALAAGGAPVPYEAALAAQLALPAGIGYAVLRHDLFGIDALLRRALAYALLSAGAVALYLALAVALTALLAGWLPQARGLAATIAVVSAAAAFTPLRDRAQRAIDRALYPERVAFAAALADARGRLAQVVRRDEAVALLCAELPRRLGAAWAELRLAPAPETCARPDAPLAWSARLQAGEEALGRYWLGPRASGLPYDPGEQQQLAALAQQASLALAYARAADELRAVNADLERRVAEQTGRALAHERALAAVEERRSLARDLHDSVTQTLFSLSLGARAIRPLVGRDADAAREALVEQEAAAQQALAEMRALLAQLRAPAVDPGARDGADLAAALRAICAAHARRGDLLVELEAPAALVLPAARCAALAQVAREALHNAARHSGAGRARVSLLDERGAVTLAVSDEGGGFDPAALPAGSYGLRGMRERAAAIGAELEIVSAPGRGAVVRLAAPREERA